jgi:hypothetical protein
VQIADLVLLDAHIVQSDSAANHPLRVCCGGGHVLPKIDVADQHDELVVGAGLMHRIDTHQELRQMRAECKHRARFRLTEVGKETLVEGPRAVPVS